MYLLVLLHNLQLTDTVTSRDPTMLQKFLSQPVSDFDSLLFSMVLCVLRYKVAEEKMNVFTIFLDWVPSTQKNFGVL